MSEKKKQIAFKGTDEYRNWIQDHARKERIKVQTLLERAVAAHLAANDSPTHRPESQPRNLVITPQTNEEVQLVTELLACLRDKRDPRAELLRRVVGTVLHTPVPHKQATTKKRA